MSKSCAIMPKLVAHFDIEMPGQCLVAWPGDQEMRFSCSIDSFEIDVRLTPDQSWSLQGKDDEFKTRVIERVVLLVSRLEEELPPRVAPRDNGTMDYTIQHDYFKARSPAFEAAAREAINRLIDYFRFQLNTPLLRPISPRNFSLINPEWKDEDGRIVGKAGSIIAVERTSGLHGELGVLVLTPARAQALPNLLNSPSSPSLVSQILSDAQGAWFEGNLRRCVLELAIACEIAAKRFFFSASSPAGAAFDYLEDKAKVSVRVLELIDRVCMDAFGRSFRADEPSKFTDIDHLFRCRNKVAHRGELTYRDDGGNKIDATSAIVRSWWDAVAALSEWLDRLQRNRP
jgi:hypothetical protein